MRFPCTTRLHPQLFITSSLCTCLRCLILLLPCTVLTFHYASPPSFHLTLHTRLFTCRSSPSSLPFLPSVPLATDLLFLSYRLPVSAFSVSVFCLSFLGLFDPLPCPYRSGSTLSPGSLFLPVPLSFPLCHIAFNSSLAPFFIFPGAPLPFPFIGSLSVFPLRCLFLSAALHLAIFCAVLLSLTAFRNPFSARPSLFFR